ncbi:ABC transporter permease [Paenibacillus sp. J5C_2022]|uniref:ABC transporter permease n=1 Tax=Paenibacillus sp. J5C2022 TaxID=2977129 RepID=UPI0021D3B76D|nr:ABC transporter permease [Paenibacillus sp. J5C2022]MCU6709567.1 ABC transporter permease [Paenibacillus sp. J5C2022]
MLKFGDLMTNEWLKMYKKKSFFIPFAIMAVFIGICTYVAARYMDGFGSATEFAEFFVSMGTAGQLLPIIAIIAIANIVPQEYRFGTIKFLLIRSQSRNKILASKYATVVLYCITLILTTLLLALIAGFGLYGFGGSGEGWAAIGENTLYLFAYTLVFATLAFMIGVLTKSNGATIGITMLSMMIGGLVTMLLSKYAFTKYILFPNVDLSVYAGEAAQPPLKGMSLTFSSVVLAAYIIVFLLASFVVFRKRDVS